MTAEKTERPECGPEFISLEGVQLSIAKRTILDHVDLSVPRGELLALIGSNGAGKSSLLRCIAGLWKPDKGAIKVDGLDRFEDDLKIRKFTAYLPPEPAINLVSVRENLRLFADAYEIPEAEYVERMDALLRMFDLKEKQDSVPVLLSKGELKKACLAGVFLTGAQLFLLDEPFTGGIDPRGHDALKTVLDRLAANRDITVVFATQVLELALALADRIAVVNHGRILAVGSPDELRETAQLSEDAAFAEVYSQLASKDSAVPVRDYLSSLGKAK